jgi:hypothetical protein
MSDGPMKKRRKSDVSKNACRLSARQGSPRSALGPCCNGPARAAAVLEVTGGPEDQLVTTPPAHPPGTTRGAIHIVVPKVGSNSRKSFIVQAPDES